MLGMLPGRCRQGRAGTGRAGSRPNISGSLPGHWAISGQPAGTLGDFRAAAQDTLGVFRAAAGQWQ